ncbi:RnfABCDGE type electron transport complex subunit D [Halomonas sp. ZH2S]|uniref:Ion-translocating oxidoreductase complex subunit D n=1 Tax=Vreelandella zhuhanensis TaxID=2684210 RepID=A0A7X3GXR3_9GAMM|nr:RnfABCDGE type electron transport complex subunit D [Halomonas zhuhanensis]MWJ26691.1 RnfABCDGE type electron transport complex subunit D [Halomonas zhuhanensis]
MSMMHASSHADTGLASRTTPPDTARLMRWVLLAMLPGIGVMTWHFGIGVLTNIIFSGLLGMGLEALMLRLRKRSIRPVLSDHSALLSGVLLGVSLPPASPWWLIGVGMIAAVVIAKHLYGGLGHNPFNPAMVGYALLLVSFPTQMTLWSPPTGMGEDVFATLRQFMGMMSATELDALSGATPLDAFKHKGEALMASEFWAANPLPPGTLLAWQHVALAWLAGGILLLYKRIISWHIPLAMLGSMLALATLLYAGDPSHHGSPAFHLFTSGAMLGAFFIATDPVSAATSRKGKLIYGAAIGLLVILLRTYGAYPDAVAFSVLLMNLAAPLLDYYSDPRPLGHSAPTRGYQLPPEDRS